MPLSTLLDHANRLQDAKLVDLAAQATGREVSAAGWTINLSRHRLDEPAETALFAFGQERGLPEAVERLFAGQHVNASEGRAALHWALRLSAPSGDQLTDRIRTSVQDALAWVKSGAADRYETIVHIGIGGSDFGPRLLTDGLVGADGALPNIRFCANVDPLDLTRALAGLDPAKTLVIGVSKSFGTEETLYNLGRVRTWLEASLGAGWRNHIVLVTGNQARAEQWLSGSCAAIFDLPDEVGGRFSIWSAASVSCMIGLGADTFEAFLKGAEAMDEHVKTAPIAENHAARLALLDYWNASVLHQTMRVQLAYSNRLRLLPTYLQQLELESNGKSISPDGEAIPAISAAALWGGEGSVGQHSYHQWLHQGGHAVPTEFILTGARGADETGQRSLLAHALAQAEVLANGRSLEDVKREEPDLDPVIQAQKVHPGGRASSLFFTETLTPEALGALIALFEHKTYLAGVLWGVNSFDQWGVERGKTMAKALNTALETGQGAKDPVTAHLVQNIRPKIT